MNSLAGRKSACLGLSSDFFFFFFQHQTLPISPFTGSLHLDNEVMAAYYDPSSSDDDGSESLSSAEEAAPGASHNTSGASDDDTYSGSGTRLCPPGRPFLWLFDLV